MDSGILNQKLSKIKMLVMDVDGTMTDGKVLYTANGEDAKRFSVRDGMGIELLKKAGIKTAILTSETSGIVTTRAEKLKIDCVMLGSRNKKLDLVQLAEKFSLNLEEIAYIGDDVNDIQPMQIAGVSVCPSDSAASVIEISHYICKQKGGDGAVREFAEMILLSQNKPITLPENW